MMRFLQQRHQSQFAQRDLSLALKLSEAQSKIRATFKSALPTSADRQALVDIFCPYTDARASGLTIAQILTEFDSGADVKSPDAIMKGVKRVMTENHPDKTSNLDLLQQAERQSIFMLFKKAIDVLRSNGGNAQAVLVSTMPPPQPRVPSWAFSSQRPQRSFRARNHRYGWS
jgi:hypothetical protein